MDQIVHILQQSGLFKALNQAELENVARAVDYVELPPGWEVIREGDVGEDMFIVVDGSVQVFTTTQEGQEIVLAKCKAGEYVGEQALLPGGQRRRNASVRAFERTTLLRVHKRDFQRALAKDSPLREQLISTSEEQMKENLLKQSALFRALQFEESQDWHREETFADQTVIFSQGDAGDFYYLILEGKVGIYQETDGEQRLLTQLDAGQGFGELALLKQTPRRASAITHGEVRVLRIDGEVFRDLYRRTPELRGYIQTLQKVYPLSTHGFVTQHTGKFMGMDSVTTMFHLHDGRTALSSHVIERDIFNMSFLAEQQEGWQTVRYQDPEQNTERELVLDGQQVVGVTSYGLWEELGRLHHMILTQTPITPEQLTTFREEGRLFVEKGLIYSDADIVCNCLQVDYGTILQGMRQGLETVDDIADKLGCSTVCGSCKPQLREIMGESGWIPVLVTEEIEVVPGIRSFRFEPCGRVLSPSKPGQHIVIKAPIDGAWIQRPYTISSGSTEVNYREVTIKREPHGYFSSWMFSQRDPEIVLQISEPQGDYFVDLEQPEPIVCFVAGIGVTPALAILRTLIAEQLDHALYIDYSAATSDSFVHRDDLQAAADAHEQIQVHFRATKEQGRVTQQEVSDLMQRYPNARVYICGPSAYQSAIESYLEASGVAADRINIEEFVPVGGAPEKYTVGELLFSRLYVIVGGVLLLLFLLQVAFQIEWPWLESAQADETFKRWTGLLLGVFILGQWVLPFLRWRGYLKAAARQYHFHKIQGALSPLFFFIHSTTLGYAYTFVLSIVFFGNFVLGLFNQEMLPESRYKKQYADYWLMTHVILSTSMVSLILYHIYVVFAYK